jgi:hypothetical protein
MLASVASAPEFTNITKSAKVLSVNLLANLSCSGIVKALDTCHNFSDCFFIVSTKCGWQCPKEFTAIPETKSKYFSPVVDVR